jgi:hypothetical protein
MNAPLAFRKFIVTGEEQIKACAEEITNLPTYKTWVVSVEPYKPSRTLTQNNAYWRILGEVSRRTGHSTTELHHWCSQEFLPLVHSSDGTSRRKRTSELHTSEFSDFLAQVEAWAYGFVGI